MKEVPSVEYLDPHLLKAADYQVLVVLERNLAVPIEIGHLHPALHVLGAGVECHAHLPISLAQQIWNFGLCQKATAIHVELLEESARHVEFLLDAGGVAPKGIRCFTS